MRPYFGYSAPYYSVAGEEDCHKRWEGAEEVHGSWGEGRRSEEEKSSRKRDRGSRGGGRSQLLKMKSRLAKFGVAGSCPLPAPHYLPLTTCPSLPVPHYLSFTTCPSLPVP